MFELYFYIIPFVNILILIIFDIIDKLEHKKHRNQFFFILLIISLILYQSISSNPDHRYYIRLVREFLSWIIYPLLYSGFYFIQSYINKTNYKGDVYTLLWLAFIGVLSCIYVTTLLIGYYRPFPEFSEIVFWQSYLIWNRLVSCALIIFWS